jgi:hypothetical protein
MKKLLLLVAVMAVCFTHQANAMFQNKSYWYHSEQQRKGKELIDALDNKKLTVNLEQVIVQDNKKCFDDLIRREEELRSFKKAFDYDKECDNKAIRLWESEIEMVVNPCCPRYSTVQKLQDNLPTALRCLEWRKNGMKDLDEKIRSVDNELCKISKEKKRLVPYVDRFYENQRKIENKK